MEFDTEFCLNTGESYESLFKQSTVNDHFLYDVYTFLLA
jgi:hypothetical protein